MAKKYLSLEEAARTLNLKNDELIRLRERGEIRGFADRGTWKFKSEDVEEYKRSRQADSDPEVPLLRDDKSVLAGDDDSVGDQSTVVRSGSDKGAPPPAPSDSDVRLILDDSFTAAADSEPELAVPGGSDSDSDVSLVDEVEPQRDEASDSDVELIGSDSDSDVTLSDPAGSGDPASDSDVKLVGSDSDSDVGLADSPDRQSDDGSDSDVKLVEAESGSDVRLSDDVAASDSDVNLVEAGSDSDVKLVGEGSGSSVVLSDDSDKEDWEYRSDSDVRLVADDNDEGPKSDSDVNLVLDEPTESGPGSSSNVSVFAEEEEDSGLALEGADSGISLEAADSGISLEDADSGVSLDYAEDSGISVGDAADSGIALENLADSGISLLDESDEDDDMYAIAGDSGISLEDEEGPKTEEIDGTVPMIDVTDGDAVDAEDTSTEVPVLDAEDDFDFAGEGDTDTSVMMFDDDDDSSATLMQEARPPSRTGETIEAEAFDIEESGEFGEMDDFDDDLHVAEDILGEEEDLEELDVFGAGDEDFEGSFETGESSQQFVVPPAGGRVQAPVETEWGAGPFAGLAISTLLMAVCALLMFDLVRSMWAWQEPYSFNSFLLDTFGGIL